MRAHHRLIGVALTVIAVTAAAVGILLVITAGQAPPDGETEPMRCNFNTTVDTTTPPPVRALDRMARRVKRFCDAMGATTPTARAPHPDRRVNARSFCVELATQGTPLPGVDCNTIPDQAVYYDRQDH